MFWHILKWFPSFPSSVKSMRGFFWYTLRESGWDTTGKTHKKCGASDDSFPLEFLTLTVAHTEPSVICEPTQVSLHQHWFPARLLFWRAVIHCSPLLVSSILRIVACFVTSLYWKKNVDFSVGFKFYLLSGSNGNFQASHMPYQKPEVRILRNVFLYHKLKNLHRVIKHMQIQYHIEQNCVAYSVNYYFSLSSYTACIFISSHVA